MLSTTQSYRLLTKNLTKTLQTTAQKPDVKREAAFYAANIGKIKTPEEFVNNRRLFAFAMKAFGMEDMTYAKAMIKKALVEGIDKKDSFANKMVDPRMREFVTAFNFARHGKNATIFEAANKGTVDRYTRQVLEADAGAQNEGVRLALYFQRKAPDIKSAYTILADTALSSVVRTALDIPESTALQDIDKQAQMISKKLDLASLKTPAKLAAFIEKFTIKYELANQPAGTDLVPQFNGGAIGQVSSSVLASLQKLKLGGG